VHFLVGKRDPTFESSQQNCVFPPCVSGCIPTLFARLIVSAEGPEWSGLEAGVWLGAAAGAVAGVSAADALVAGAAALAAAAGAAAELEDCWAEHGSAADRTPQIKMEEVENFTMRPPMFDRHKPSARKSQALPESNSRRYTPATL